MKIVFDHVGDMLDFARLQGWQLENDNYGQIMFYTGIVSDDGEHLREMEEKDFLEKEENGN